MAGSSFKSLEEMKSSLIRYRDMCERTDKDRLAGMGALEPLVTAILKLVEEVEVLKAKLGT